MSSSTPQSSTKSGIETSADGASFIPSSKRADGSLRKEIRVRPGYRPPEDVETYKNRSAEAWKNRGSGGVPGAEPVQQGDDHCELKSKNATRREAARRRAQANGNAEGLLVQAIRGIKLSEDDTMKENEKPGKGAETEAQTGADTEVETQKKIRNLLKKLRAVRELKEKKATGEKLSHDQLMKMGKESDIVKDLRKLGHDEDALPKEDDGGSSAKPG